MGNDRKFNLFLCAKFGFNTIMLIEAVTVHFLYSGFKNY